MVDSEIVWQARTDGVVWRPVGDDVVIMDLVPGVYYSLRGVGGRIWQLLAEHPHTSVQLIEELLEAFDVSRTTLEADVTRFVEELHGTRLLVQIP